MHHLNIVMPAVFMALVVFPQVGGADDLFQDQVAPILAERCLTCHRDDDAKGGFSVESRERFFEDGYVDPGDAVASHLVDLITAVDGKAEMPRTGPPLTESQIRILSKWIENGAAWPDGFLIQKRAIDFDWWSLKPIRSPELPTVNDGDSWIRNEIDRWVLEGIQGAGLQPSPEADRRSLIRRLSYDLTGLPPSYDEVVAFEKDTSPDAYEKLVDRLLASPRYGERWARHWLDIVKYADTCGYDKDKIRAHAWPYRDYVIRSFNRDKPYAQFIREQIAGDRLFPGSPDGILGLGFIAAGPWDFIGHVEVPESKRDGKVARNLDRDDMVANTLNTFCSVTIQCARCHDHKFDPFTQEHYYGLQSVFAAVDRANRVYQSDPEIEKRREQITATIAGLRQQRAELTERLNQAGGESLVDLDREIAAARAATKKPQFGFHSQVASVPELEKWVEVELPKKEDLSRIVLHPCHDDFAGIGAGFGFPIRYRVEIDGGVVHETDDDLPNPGLAAVEIPVAAPGSVVRIVATKLAERKNDFIFALAELEIFDSAGQNLAPAGSVRSLDSIEMPVRWARANLVDGIWFAPANQDLDTLINQRTDLIESLLGPEFLANQERVKASIAAEEKKLAALPAGKLVYAAATDFSPQGNFKPTCGTPRVVRLLQRGNIDQPGPLVKPGALPVHEGDDFILAGDDEAGRRAALAEWIASPENPLTWRSIVNRVWHYHFNQGIVDTPNDLGRMGGNPTHPQLLDWLAAEFRDRGGSFKWLHRQIVTSATYRQSSRSYASARARDAGNRLLWKMPRRRLSAEEIRDSILQASGKLDLRMGGPGFQLFELEKTEHSPHYEYHKFDHSDPETFRRSIYRFVVRSQPDPYMTTLDCADSSQSTPVRNETQTPLQALTMWNSDFNLRMAEFLAEDVRDQSAGIEAQVRLMVQRTLGRAPTEEEFASMLAHARANGLSSLARILFNLSEFVYVD